MDRVKHGAHSVVWRIVAMSGTFSDEVSVAVLVPRFTVGQASGPRCELQVASTLTRKASRHSFIRNQPVKEASNICCDAQILESYSTTQSIGVVRLLLIAVNARCAVHLIAWLHSAAPASLRASAAVRHAWLPIPSFQLVQAAAGDALPFYESV